MAADRNAVHATTALYTAHYRSLVGLAVLLVRDMSTAEEIVQDSFVAMHTQLAHGSGTAAKHYGICGSVWSTGPVR